MQVDNVVLHIPMPYCNGMPIQIRLGYSVMYGDKLSEKPKPEDVKK